MTSSPATAPRPRMVLASSSMARAEALSGWRCRQRSAQSRALGQRDCRASVSANLASHPASVPWTFPPSEVLRSPSGVCSQARFNPSQARKVSPWVASFSPCDSACCRGWIDCSLRRVSVANCSWRAGLASAKSIKTKARKRETKVFMGPKASFPPTRLGRTQDFPRLPENSKSHLAQ